MSSCCIFYAAMLIQSSTLVKFNLQKIKIRNKQQKRNAGNMEIAQRIMLALNYMNKTVPEKDKKPAEEKLG